MARSEMPQMNIPRPSSGVGRKRKFHDRERGVIDKGHDSDIVSKEIPVSDTAEDRSWDTDTVLLPHLQETQIIEDRRNLKVVRDKLEQRYQPNRELGEKETIIPKNELSDEDSVDIGNMETGVSEVSASHADTTPNSLRGKIRQSAQEIRDAIRKFRKEHEDYPDE